MLGNDNLIAPYLEWAVATRFAYLNGRWFRVLLELNRSATSFWSMAKKWRLTTSLQCQAYMKGHRIA